MSAKWRALQHRHRYTYNSVVFPKHFIEAVDLLLLQDNLSSTVTEFFFQLKKFASLTSTYAQISDAKDIAASFTKLLSTVPESNDDLINKATCLYLEIMFLENSLPLHRTLISALAKTKKFLPLIAECFRSLCEEYSLDKIGKKRFVVSRAALSLMGYPKLGFLNEAIEKCSVLASRDVVHGLESVMKDIDSGSRPSPTLMEQCQEGMSCLYYLLQKFPNKFVDEEEGLHAFDNTVRTILKVLRSTAFSRDCLVAGGVSFCAALQACMSPEELSDFFPKYFFNFHSKGGDIGDLGPRKVLPSQDLYLEMKDLSALSRLCLLRGILTAIPRPILNVQLVENNSSCVWTILFNGILPELCNYCEDPIDSHFNFHALTVAQICLQQIKTSILGNLTDFSSGYDPLPEAMVSRILRIIWNNLEDPLSQTVKQVNLIFDLLLNIQSSIPSEVGGRRYKSLLSNISESLLCLGARCKGRYVPLASLTRRLGAKSLLELNSSILYETTYAYIDDDVCSAATTFLKCFLECIRNECWTCDGIEEGYNSFRGICLPPLLQGLMSGNSKLRTNLNIYALPVFLEVDTDSIFQMLGYISVGPRIEVDKLRVTPNVDQCVAALVSLLKVSRMLALIDGDIEKEDADNHNAVICLKAVNVELPIEWLSMALMHSDESLRIDAAESLFLNPKTASLPSSLELSLMREVIPSNMRCSSTAFQMKWTNLFRKFFSRTRTALERLIKQGLWQPNTYFNSKSNGSVHDTKDTTYKAEELFMFMKWLSCFLFYSCYPSAPYERKTMAMALILIMVDVWPVHLHQENADLHPYRIGFTKPDSTLLLAGSMIDSWDRLRESSFRILLSFPAPLPGLDSQDSVKDVIKWAKRLVCSPRVRESDAGALTFRLIFRKYVMDLGWFIGASINVVCVNSHSDLSNNYHQKSAAKTPVVDYLSSLIEWLHVLVKESEKDLLEACRKSFVHGVLLTLRYTFEELDWNSEVLLSSSCQMKCLLENLFSLIMRIASLALWVVSADVWSMPYDIEDLADDDVFVSEISIEIDRSGILAEQSDGFLKSDNNRKPAEQVVMVGCWLAMKEVSLLLGTIVRKFPLPGSNGLNFSNSFSAASNTDGAETISLEHEIIDVQQLETIGNHFLQVLLKMKHNGAIDKTRAGFIALCNRLLCSNDPRLCKMTESWMEQLMERTVAKGQTVDDLLRRSAGIPAAFIALFLSEPEGTPKKLLPHGLRWLVDIANTPTCKTCESVGNGPSQCVGMEVAPTIMASKIRDDGVIPTVHAFNSLRAAFNDTNLATDTSGFCAEAIVASICSFSSPYWEVRNSACLAYTALVRRMIGFLNVQKRESAKRVLTGLEFFHRYPALHPFIFNELKIAAQLLGDTKETTIAKAIHPSLCPILILLSRLKPSPISSEGEDFLDPFLFMPFIQKCATQNNLRVRVLASKALTGMVSNEKLYGVINDIAHYLPQERDEIETRRCTSFNAIHGILLQLSSLVDNNCRNLNDIAQKDQILGTLVQVFLDCSWIGSKKLCPCPTLNSSFLRVLDQMLGVARSALSKHVTTIERLLLELSSECLDKRATSLLTFYDPTNIELHKQAASSYFSCLLGDDQEDVEYFSHIKIHNNSTVSKFPKVIMTGISAVRLHEQITCCISDSSYEVRLATLKWLLRTRKSLKMMEDNVIMMWSRTHLQSTMMQQLASEENPKCLYYILKIIFLWNVLQLENSTVYVDFGSAILFWEKLVHLNSTVRRMKTREMIVCCMGICLKQLTTLFLDSIVTDQTQISPNCATKKTYVDQPTILEVQNCVTGYISLIKQHSAPAEPVNMRRAAAESIIACGILEQSKLVASFVSNDRITDEPHVDDVKMINESKFDISEVRNLYGCQVLDLWFISIGILEDEDVDLRQKFAKEIHTCISSKKQSAQVDRVIESSFNFLSITFGHWLEYTNYMLRWNYDTANSGTPPGDFVRRIFDKEIDNHHEEKLLICQLCCFNLEKLLISKPWMNEPNCENLEISSIEMFFKNWTVRFFHQLISLANELIQTQGITEWIGGIGNHKDVFTPIYVNMLGIYVLTKFSSFNSSSGGLNSTDEVYLSELTEFCRIIKPFLRNPLISNLYMLMIQAHRNSMDLSPPVAAENTCLDWGNFNPYFLLR